MHKGALAATMPSVCSINRNLPLHPSIPTAPLALHHPSIPTVPLTLPPSIDTHQALGSPDRRTGAKRLRGLTAPILPTSYPQIHCTDSLYETTFFHGLSAPPSPPPYGRYLSSRGRGKGLCADITQNSKGKDTQKPSSADLRRRRSCFIVFLSELCRWYP